MTNDAVWLSCYGYIFAILSYLITAIPCLTIFFSKNYVSLERFTLEEVEKTIKPFKKEKRKKCHRLTNFVNK